MADLKIATTVEGVTFIKTYTDNGDGTFSEKVSGGAGGGGDATAANQATANGYLATIAAASSDTNPAAVIPAASAPTNRSGTITAGGTAQQAMAANTSRRAWKLHNRSSEYLYYSFTGTAISGGGSGSFPCAPGQVIESQFGAVENTAMSIVGATTGSAFTLQEM